jgi:hypothetical protein
MATVTKFTITKGNKLDFYIIVKEAGTVSPLALAVGDTFSYTLIEKETGNKFATNTTMSIIDGPNGKIKGTITAAVSGTLPMKVGMAEDGYLPRASMRLVVKGVTAAQGEFVAAIENVYVIAG